MGVLQYEEFPQYQEKPGFSGNIPLREILCQPAVGNVCEKDRKTGQPDWDLRQQKGGKQCGETPPDPDSAGGFPAA